MGIVAQLEGVTVKRGVQRILRDVDLTVHEGQHLALIGPNGAGKTTLLRILAQLTRPDEGQATLFPDEPAMRHRVRTRKALGVLMEGSYLYEGLTVEENLQFFGKLYAVPDLKRRIEDGLARVELTGVRHRPAGTLSKGMRKRLALLRAMLHHPRLLLLDEPFDGLDERSIALLQRWLAELAEKRCTLVLISHDLALMAPLCRRVCLLDRGQIVQSWKKDEVPPGLWEQGYGPWLGRDGR
jgi:heme ABC exporter ATP-binding subunit CcmA